MLHERTSLYDIPLNHLDYQYISGCNKLKELEKILKVLRSGSEGRYPDLERHCEEKIRSLDPDKCVIVLIYLIFCKYIMDDALF